MAKRKKPDTDVAEAETPTAVAQLLPAGEPTQEPPEPAPSPLAGYTVLARRYRPQHFADLVGQEPVAQALVNALNSNRVAHAYLFTGARGVGKTSTARILAKALNCSQGPTPTPCDVCENCLAITAGEDLDVVEIDGASNRQIDDIREIRQNVQYRPSRSRHKIYIIDEVHMLTKEAFNALLKTLEEPPPHVKFIFATTDVHKVPVTILSRCQRFDFVSIGSSRIVDRLREIVAAEGMEADAEALEFVARRAGGSMRDAQSLLDQLLAFGGQKLTAEQVHRLLGTANDERVLALAGAILERDPKGALAVLDQAADDGLQLGELLDQLLDYWRDLMVVHCAGADARQLSVSSRHRETLAQQAKTSSLDTILAGLDILGATKSRLRGSSHALIWLQTAVVRLSRLDNLVALSQLVQQLSDGGVARGPERPAASDKRPQAVGVSQPPRTEQPRAVLPALAPTPAPRPAASAALSLTAESLQSSWPQILAQLSPFLRAALEKSVPAISGPNSLVIRFAADYNVQGKHFTDLGGVDKLEGYLSKATGQKWSVQAESALPAAPAPTAAAVPEAAAPPAGRSRQQREEEALKEPLVRRAREVFRASFDSIDEGFGSSPGALAEPTADADPEEEA